MNQSLEKRVSALEQASPKSMAVMYIILVGMGDVGMELTLIHDNDGNQWKRRARETEEAFKDRATSETPRTVGQVSMLFGEISRIGHGGGWQTVNSSVSDE